MRLVATILTRRAAITTSRFSSPVSVSLVLAALSAGIIVISLNMRMRGHLSDGQGYRFSPTFLAELAVGELCSLSDPHNDPASQVWKSELVDSVAPVDCSDDGKKRWEPANLEFLTLA